jgi:TonB family protein
MRKILFLVMALFLLPLFLPAQYPTFEADRFRSWRDVGRLAEFQLSEAQIQNIENSIKEFEDGSGDFRSKLRDSEGRILQLMKNQNVDETGILNEVKSIEQAHVAREKANLLLIFSIRKNFTNEQWAKLLRGPGVVNPPRALMDPMPAIPRNGKGNAIEGAIRLEIVVHKDGTATVAKVLQSLGAGFDENAIDIVNKNWRFQPGSLDGQIIEMRRDIGLYFFEGAWSKYPY